MRNKIIILFLVVFGLQPVVFAGGVWESIKKAHGVPSNSGGGVPIIPGLNPFRDTQHAVETVEKIADGDFGGAIKGEVEYAQADEVLGKVKQEMEHISEAVKNIADGDVKGFLSNEVENASKNLAESLEMVASFLPDEARYLIDQLDVIPPVLIPGKHCGPENDFLTNMVIPDRLLFQSGTVVEFSKACEKHDNCYSDCGPKADCDRDFGVRMKEECDAKLSGAARSMCHKLADTYHEAVEKHGDESYKESCG